MKGVADEDNIQIQRAAFEHHLALMGNSGLTENSFKSVQTRANEDFWNFVSVMRPWEGDAGSRKQKETEDLRSSWFRAFNVDPNDPSWKAKSDADLQLWRERRAEKLATSDESIEERIRRKLHEHRQKVARLTQLYHAARQWKR